MAYTKRTIKDRVSTTDNRFTNSGDATDLILTPDTSGVTEAGTPIDKAFLEVYENALFALGSNIDGGNSANVNAHDDHPNGIMGTKITVRRATTTEWSTNNPVLDSGEIAYDTLTKKIKVGDGSTAWSNLKEFAFTNDIGDATLTFNVNGSVLFAFKANQKTNKTANLSAVTSFNGQTGEIGLHLYEHNIKVVSSDFEIDFILFSSSVHTAYTTLSDVVSTLNDLGFTSKSVSKMASGNGYGSNIVSFVQAVYASSGNLGIVYTTLDTTNMNVSVGGVGMISTATVIDKMKTIF